MVVGFVRKDSVCAHCVKSVGNVLGAKSGWHTHTHMYRHDAAYTSNQSA